MAKSKIADSADIGQTGLFPDPTGPSDVPPSSQPGGPAPDPFDPASLRLSGDLNVDVAVKKVLLTIPVRKPNRGDFVRVHPSADYRLTTFTLELREEFNELYLIAPHLASQLIGSEKSVSPRTLATAVNRSGVLFLWPLRPVTPDGRRDEWARTAMEAAELATRSWVRVEANSPLGAYEVKTAIGQLPEPEWPELTMRDILAIAFRDKYITDVAHPVLRKLRGEL